MPPDTLLMKSPQEIYKMLLNEIIENEHSILSADRNSIYFNQQAGDTSFLLAGLLDSLLKRDFEDWDKDRWIDDSLLMRIEIENKIAVIDGVMIWGIENSTGQWTDPFHFEMNFASNLSHHSVTFLFADLDNPELTYEEFSHDRQHWNPRDRNWRFIIASKFAHFE